MISEFYQQRDVQLGPTNVLGAALLSPGFCEDLTTWRLTIDESGLITQEIFLCCYPQYDHKQFVRISQLTREQLSHLLQLAVEIDFARLNKEYDSGADDVETTTIVLKTPSGTKHVYASDAFFAAELDGNTDMQRYVRFWEAIHEYAPTTSPQWRAEREEIALQAEIEMLKQRAMEKDFLHPSFRELYGVAFNVPIVVFTIQMLYPRFGRSFPVLPTLTEFLIFTGVGYALVTLLFFYDIRWRRRERLAAQQQLDQYQAVNSVMNDEQPKTKN